jgi:transposase-like protein
VQEAYVQGISTRRVDDLVQALGMTGISKSHVSRIFGELDAEGERFRTRQLEGPYPLCLAGRDVRGGPPAREVVWMAVVIVVGGPRQGSARSSRPGRGAERG